MAHHLRQRDPHRADAFAPPAESRRIGQMAGFFDADQRRRQHRAHRPGIDPAIGMAADRAIDRAMIEAGGAADAAQHVLELACPAARCGHCRAARRGIPPAHRVSPARRGPVETRGVGRELLAGRRARQKPQERRRVLERRHDFLDARQHDMRLGQSLRQIAIALVGDDDGSSRFRRPENWRR